MKFIKYQLQIGNRKLSDCTENYIEQLWSMNSIYGIQGYGETNDDKEYLVVFGKIMAVTAKECKGYLRTLKSKLKEIFEVGRIVTLVEFSGETIF